MTVQNVVFMNKALNLRLAGTLYLPDHFDLYDLAPYVPEAFTYIVSFFLKNLGKAE